MTHQAKKYGDAMTEATAAPKNAFAKLLDLVERLGNKVPHPAVLFFVLIALVAVLSHVLYLLGASVSYQRINLETHQTEAVTTAVSGAIGSPARNRKATGSPGPKASSTSSAPIMWSVGTGADVMKRIAAPMIGGIFTSFILELIVYPAVYEVWKWHFELKKELAHS